MMSKYNDEDFNKVKTILDHIKGDLAVLSGEKGVIELPKRLLPKNIKEGDPVYISLATEEGERKQREIKAKELLNEILRGE